MNIFILTIFLSIKIIFSQNETILFVFQMNRNGARAPDFGVNNGSDLYLEKWNSNGELSNVGKRQQYLLGVKSRKKYIENYKLLSEYYNPQEIFIKSTDYNRTIESAYSFIQGLYPNGKGQIINENIASIENITYPPNKDYTQRFETILSDYSINNSISALPYNMTIVPIHSFYTEDQFQLYDINNCPGIKNISEKQKNRKEIKNFAKKLMEENKELFKDLEKKFKNKSQINDTFLEDYWTLYRYMDNLACDEKDQRDFSKLINEYSHYSFNLDNLKKNASEFLKDDYKANKNSQNISIIDASNTLHSILNWTDNAIKKYENNDTQQYIKYVIYSTHGSSIGTLDFFMNYYFNITIDDIDFAESRYFELYIDNDNEKKQYKIRYLKGDNTVKMDLEYKSFIGIVKKKIWSEQKITEFCYPIKKDNKNDNKNKDINIFGASIMIILSVLDGVLIVLLILYCLKK